MLQFEQQIILNEIEDDKCWVVENLETTILAYFKVYPDIWSLFSPFFARFWTILTYFATTQITPSIPHRMI
jgi:hypothetical protein